MKNLTFLLRTPLLLIFFFPVCDLSAGERLEPVCLVGELRERVNEIGSFRAEYKSMSNSSRDVEIVHDAENLRTVLRMTEVESGDFLIVETLRLPEQDALQIRFFDGTAGQMIRLTAGDFQDAIESSVRAFTEVLALFFNEVADETERIFPQFVEQLSFEVNEEAASVSLGWHVSSTAGAGLAFSWLDKKLVEEASERLESEKKWQLTFANGRRLVIDRGTGILISDHFPDPADPEIDLRWIRRKGLSVYGADGLPEGLLPDLSIARFEELDGRAMFAEMKEQFTRIAVGQMIRENMPVLREPARLRKMIEENREKVGARLRELGRKSALGAGEQTISEDQIERLVESVLIPVYQEYRDSESDPVSFDRFIEKIFEMEQGALAGIVNRLAGTGELQMKERKPEILGMAPVDVRESLAMLFEASLPPFIEGWRVGMTEGIVERIHASGAARALDD